MSTFGAIALVASTDIGLKTKFSSGNTKLKETKNVYIYHIIYWNMELEKID